jgi:hypothetical protein
VGAATASDRSNELGFGSRRVNRSIVTNVNPSELKG